MKTLHLVAHEKFLRHIVEVSEAINPGNNVYAKVRGSAGIGRIDVLHDSAAKRGFAAMRFQKPEDMLTNADAIFAHPLLDFMIQPLSKARPDTVLVWCGMGGDYYRFAPSFRDTLILPMTKHKMQAMRKFPWSLMRPAVLLEFLRRLVRFAQNREAAEASMDRFASRVDFFCILERGLKLQALPGFRAREIANFGYYSLEGSLCAGGQPIHGRDLLIGNSATWTNNHFDLFQQMRKLDLGDRRIILPLNYGGDGFCAESVVRAANDSFGSERVVPLLKWMPIDHYNRTLSRCGTVIMNHVRGQAMGNLCSMIYRGAKVYIRKENPYAEFFEGLGVKVFFLPTGPLDQRLFEPLSPEIRKKNSELMREFWRFQNVTKRTRALFEIVEREVVRRRFARRNREPFEKMPDRVT